MPCLFLCCWCVLIFINDNSYAVHNHSFSIPRVSFDHTKLSFIYTTRYYSSIRIWNSRFCYFTVYVQLLYDQLLSCCPLFMIFLSICLFCVQLRSICQRGASLNGIQWQQRALAAYETYEGQLQLMW